MRMTIGRVTQLVANNTVFQGHCHPTRVDSEDTLCEVQHPVLCYYSPQQLLQSVDCTGVTYSTSRGTVTGYRHGSR